MSLASGVGTILGGLPVWADIASGKDPDGPWGPGEYWSEVQTLYWVKRDGSKGKELPQHIVDRAENYDYGFCNLIESIFDQLSHESWLKQMDADCKAAGLGLLPPLQSIAQADFPLTRDHNL